jgi:predicted small secreted protein
MMMKRFGLVTAACLALALVFAACQNGVQEVEGNIGVGISSRALSAPAVDYPLPDQAWIDGGQVDLPSYIVISWTAGPGFEKEIDSFVVFAQIGGKNTYFALTANTAGGTPNYNGAYVGTGAAPTNVTKYQVDGSALNNSNIDKWYAKINPLNLIGDMGFPSLTQSDAAYVEIMTDIQTKGIRFGVQTVIADPTTYTGDLKPSGISWTGLLKP